MAKPEDFHAAKHLFLSFFFSLSFLFFRSLSLAFLQCNTNYSMGPRVNASERRSNWPRDSRQSRAGRDLKRDRDP